MPPDSNPSAVRRAFSLLGGQLFPPPDTPPAPQPEPAAPRGYTSLFVTGRQLVQRVQLAVHARRPVLLTGPRGSGKSYCAKQGILLSRESGVIGGWRFLQGNREIPRDTLSEDMLVVGGEITRATANTPAMPKLETLVALALRPLERSTPRDRQVLKRQLSIRESCLTGVDKSQLAEDSNRFLGITITNFRMLRDYWEQTLRHWPAVPESAIRAKAHPVLDPTWAWVDADWWVLFLDEVNRFGDGFLDSLLSLTEEGTVVRRGEDYRVPVTVVCTANPPGYDPTAKKLSPPLQARIARAYRVTQPPPENLICILSAKFGNPNTTVSPRIGAAVAAVMLCLWGDPKGKAVGLAYLSKSCRARLEKAKDAVPGLAAELAKLGGLIEFGPDARAANDWLDTSVGLASAFGVPVGTRYLLDTVCEVLGNKVRENFSEGASPGSVADKEEAIGKIAELVLADLFPTEMGRKQTESKLQPIFFPLVLAAERLLSEDLSHDMVWKRMGELWDGIEKKQNPDARKVTPPGPERGLMAFPAERRLELLDALVKVPNEVTSVIDVINAWQKLKEPSADNAQAREENEFFEWAREVFK